MNFSLIFVLLTTVIAFPYLIYGGLYFLQKDNTRTIRNDAEPTISIVLPTYNEQDIIEQKIADILALDYPMEKVEVVIVDSSDDRTPEIVNKQFENRDAPALTYIKENERRGLAPALNDAYAAAKNDIVVKTDCDSLLASDSLREAAGVLSNPEIGAVTGMNDEVLGGSKVEAGYRGIQAYIQTLETRLDSTLIFHGPFSAFENDKIVPLDPNSLADDTELALKIRRNGKRVVFNSAIRYKEASFSEFAKRRKQKDRRGMGLIRLLVQHRDALGKYGNYGRIVLPFNWWFMIISPWLLLLDTLFATAAAVSIIGFPGIAIPGVLWAFMWLGQLDNLGPFQPFYALLDTQISLLHAAFLLVTSESDGTWDVDEELRDVFQ